MAIEFENPEQWAEVVSKIQSGLKPCRLCGEWRKSLYRIPNRFEYRPAIDVLGQTYIYSRKYIESYQSSNSYNKVNDWYRPVVVVFEYVCEYCLAQLSNEAKRQKLRHFKVCAICGVEFDTRKEEYHICAHYSQWKIEYFKKVLGYSLSRNGFVCMACHKELMSEWERYRAEKERWRAWDQAQRSHLNRYEIDNNEADDPMTLEQWDATLDYFENTCAYCDNSWEVREHFVPVTMGGDFVIGNIIPACRHCNSTKHSQHPIPWMYGHCDTERIEKIIAWASRHNVVIPEINTVDKCSHQDVVDS